jgi:hypothetical protein
VEFFPTEEEARAALADVLRDEPEWVDEVRVAALDLNGWPTWRVARVA